MTGRALSRASRCGLLLLCGPILLSCGANTRANPFGGRGGPAEPAELVVENRNWADMTIIVDRAGSRTRLGTVSTNHTRTFELSSGMVPPGSSVTFVADPVGSTSTYSSPRVPVGPGDSYRWTLAGNLVHSSLVRR